MNAREEWLEQRRLGIGGSDMHHIFNDKPYGCARRLAYEKLNIPQDLPDGENDAMALGSFLESWVADRYAEDTGRTLRRRKSQASKEHPWARVNVDREIVIAPDRPNDGPGVLEIKTHNGWLFRKVKNEGLKAAHIRQLQHALMVNPKRYGWGAFCVTDRESGKRVAFDVERDEELIAQQREAGEKFWRNLQAGKLPTPLSEIDARCQKCPWRITCRGIGALQELSDAPDERSAEIERDDTFAELLGDYREAKQIADEANSTLEAIEFAIKTRMGERPVVQADGIGRVTFRQIISQRIDTKALEKAHPEIAKQFRKPSQSRPLRIHLF